MYLRNKASRMGTLMAAGILALSGCSTDGSDTAQSPGPESSPSETTTAGTEVSASFELLDGRPEGYDDVEGTATLKLGDGTEGEISLTGLKPDTAYVAHVHQQACDMDQGGPHFKFDPAGSDMPPNEIHWNFVSDTEGSAEATTSNPQAVADPQLRAVVVHENPDTMSGSDDMSGQTMGAGHTHQQKIACADLA